MPLQVHVSHEALPADATLELDTLVDLGYREDVKPKDPNTHTKGYDD